MVNRLGMAFIALELLIGCLFIVAVLHALRAKFRARNLNLKNFVEWTCFPTLVYELEYPREEKIKWWYVAEKTAATFGVFGVSGKF